MPVRLAQTIRAQANRAVAAVARESSMSRLVLAAIALTGAAVSAQAADLPYYPPRPPAYGPLTAVQPRLADCWLGPYLGGNIGYAWGSVDNNPAQPSGFLGGGQGGYSWRLN